MFSILLFPVDIALPISSYFVIAHVILEKKILCKFVAANLYALGNIELMFQNTLNYCTIETLLLILSFFILVTLLCLLCFLVEKLYTVFDGATPRAAHF